MPGAWAASTSVSTPSRSSSRTIVSIGKTRPLGLVTWLTSAIRVRGVTPPRNASTTSSGCRIGSGIDDPDDPGLRPLGGRGQGVEGRVVLVVVGQELVAGPKPQRAEDRRDAGRGVRDHDEARGVGVEERRRPSAGGIQAVFELPGQELDRVRLQLEEQRPLGLEDRPRARAVRAVVQEQDRRVEVPRAVWRVRTHGSEDSHGEPGPLTERPISGIVIGLRGVEQRQLVGLITRRSEVRILPPQPIASTSNPGSRPPGVLSFRLRRGVR